MRVSRFEDAYIIAEFATLDTVTVTIYDLSDNSVVASAVSMTEIGTTGVFKYLFAPTVVLMERYLAIATNGATEVIQEITVGGYIDNTVGLSNTAIGALAIQDIHTELDSYANKADYKADVSGIDTKTDDIQTKVSTIGTQTDTIKGIVDPEIIDPKKNYNEIKADLYSVPRTHGDWFKVKMNSTLKDILIIQAEILPNANSFQIDSHVMQIVVDNGYVGETFLIYQ